MFKKCSKNVQKMFKKCKKMLPSTHVNILVETKLSRFGVMNQIKTSNLNLDSNLLAEYSIAN